LHGDRMASRSNNLLGRMSIKNFQRMNNLSHRLCIAPMMDRNDSFSTSIGCEAACAERVHEGIAIYFARVRCNAIFARLCKASTRKNASASSRHNESAQPGHRAPYQGMSHPRANAPNGSSTCSVGRKRPSVATRSARGNRETRSGHPDSLSADARIDAAANGPRGDGRAVPSKRTLAGPLRHNGIVRLGEPGP